MPTSASELPRRCLASARVFDDVLGLLLSILAFAIAAQSANAQTALTPAERVLTAPLVAVDSNLSTRSRGFVKEARHDWDALLGSSGERLGWSGGTGGESPPCHGPPMFAPVRTVYRSAVTTGISLPTALQSVFGGY